jgi:site-specific DNA-methyltransferase (adenine-specific)
MMPDCKLDVTGAPVIASSALFSLRPYYQDASVTLYHGDALEILPRLGKVNAIITDPPYGVREDEEWDNLDERAFALHVMEWLPKAKRACDELVVCCSCYSPMRDLCEMIWPRVRVIIWDKPTGSQYAGSSERGLWFAHETLLHCYEPKQIAQPKCLEPARLLKLARESVGLSRGGVDMVVRGKKTGLCFRWEEAACLPTPEQVAKLKTVLPLNGDFDAALAAAGQTKQATMEMMRSMAADGRDVMSYRTVTGGMHSCQKPLGLMQELIQRLTNPGDVIADPFAGSGTTLLAAKELGRRAVGVELEEKNCETIAARCAQDCLALGG